MLQFGYVSMFSVAFPAGAIAATFTNIIELRLDAYKFTFATRRPSFEGADGIGSWKYVMEAYSWIALVVNVLVVAYASNSVRDWIIAPAQADEWHCADASAAELASGEALSSLISDRARFYGEATSWRSACATNRRECFADIGAVEWLPATLYLNPLEETSRSYQDHGLCNEESPLYNLEHCQLCRDWSAETYLGLVWFVVILEHLLILIKIIVRTLVPDKPAWVRRGEARTLFMKDQMAQETIRQSARVEDD